MVWFDVLDIEWFIAYFHSVEADSPHLPGESGKPYTGVNQEYSPRAVRNER